MQKEIESLLDRKEIHNPYLRQLVTIFILNHTKLYSHIVSYQDLMTRLEKGLNNVVFVDRSERGNIEGTTLDTGGTYNFVTRNITLFVNEDEFNENYQKDWVYEATGIEDPDKLRYKRNNEDIIMHELVHCAYTKRDYTKLIEHIFVTSQIKEDGTLGKTGYCNTTLMEPIVNFIATTILRRPNFSYVASTANIKRLSEKIGVDTIIESAWNSEEYKLISAFENLAPGKAQQAYHEFCVGISLLDEGRYDDGIYYIDKIIDGKDRMTEELKASEQRLAELEKLKKEREALGGLKEDIIQFEQQEDLRRKNIFSRLRKKSGFINIISLIMFVLSLILVTVFISTIIIKRG